MEELPSTEDIITKLKSSLPICRVCLNVSMEYIEFEATLCIVDGHEITFSEGFHELIPDPRDLPHQNMTTYFCAKCGKDLLHAYLFIKRIEHANCALNKVKISTEEGSKLFFDDHDDYNDDEEDKKDVIYISIPELENYKEDNETEIYQNKSEDIIEETASKISSSFHESVKIEELEGDSESVYEAVYDEEVFIEKEELLSEPKTEILVQQLDEDGLKSHSNKIVTESAALLSNEFVFLCETEEEGLEQKELNSHENKLTMCDKLLENNDIKSHILVSQQKPTEKKDYICIICSCAFQTKRSLNFHKRVTHKITETNHQKAQEYKKCQYCRRMIRKSNMEIHLLTHSTGTENEYNCNVCEETFATKIDVKQHSYTHTKDRYACQICGKICMRPFTLRKHIQAKHLSERRKHQCEDCGLFFSFPSLLKEHQRKHNMNNRFKCSHCDRTFMRKPQLDIHMRYHMNDFPYKCNQCDKCYVSKSNLTDHIRSKHTKTTYDCDRCKQKFKSQTGLRKHKYAHDGYPYNCPLCSVGQTSRSGMKQHLMGVHKDALTEEEFDIMFPIIIPRTGYRRHKHLKIQ